MGAVPWVVFLMPMSEFDGSLWGSMVEFVTVGRNKEITVTFRDGSEMLA